MRILKIACVILGLGFLQFVPWSAPSLAAQWFVRVNTNDKTTCEPNTIRRQGKWTEFYAEFNNISIKRFYFSPDSVNRCGSLVSLYWTNGDLSGETLSVYGTEIQCKGDTWRLLYVDKVASDGTTNSTDLRDAKVHRDIKNTIGDPLSRYVCSERTGTPNGVDQEGA
jgi:hypothetical protein